MAAYILRRILLMIPTLFGIMLLSFLIIQFAPGGPVEQAIARMSGQGGSAMATVTGGAGDLVQPLVTFARRTPALNALGRLAAFVVARRE